MQELVLGNVAHENRQLASTELDCRRIAVYHDGGNILFVQCCHYLLADTTIAHDDDVLIHGVDFGRIGLLRIVFGIALFDQSRKACAQLGRHGGQKHGDANDEQQGLAVLAPNETTGNRDTDHDKRKLTALPEQHAPLSSTGPGQAACSKD